jgi:hypothetical protein
MTTPALLNLHLAELVNALARARDLVVYMADEDEKPDVASVEDAVKAIENAADFIDDIRLSSHEGGAR